MSKKRNFALITTILLAILIVTAAITPTLAFQKQSETNSGSKGNHASVTLQLPPGGGALVGRPVDILLLAYDYGSLMGYSDVIIVTLWVPAMNQYVPLAVISDQAPNAQVKSLWNGTPVYMEVNSVVIRNNLKTVSDKELNVWMEYSCSGHGNGALDTKVLIANLTVPVLLDFTGLPSTIFGSVFTVPAMTLVFRAIDDGYLTEEVLTFPSGYSMKSSHTSIPAWVKASIPAWLSTHALTVSGVISYRETITMTGPQ